MEKGLLRGGKKSEEKNEPMSAEILHPKRQRDRKGSPQKRSDTSTESRTIEKKGTTPRERGRDENRNAKDAAFVA